MGKTGENRHGGTWAEIAHLPNCMNCRNDIGPGEAYETREDENGQSRVWHATHRAPHRKAGYKAAICLPVTPK